VKPGSARANQRLQEASGRVWGILRLNPLNRNLGGRRMRRHTPIAHLPRDFHTAWAQSASSRRSNMAATGEHQTVGGRGLHRRSSPEADLPGNGIPGIVIGRYLRMQDAN